MLFDHADDPNQDDAKAVVEQYRRIADAAIDDAGTRLRQGALSRAMPEAMPDAIMVTDEAGVTPQPQGTQRDHGAMGRVLQRTGSVT